MASETSYWINFFTTAGIPAGDAAHYAVMFSDNRITRAMLLDLSKDYLTDMGITRLGDIIAILKHAKEVYNQEAKDKILKSTPLSSQMPSSSFGTETPRRSTAASRMVNHFTRKYPEAAPMCQAPVPRNPPSDPPRTKRTISVFDRLGAEGPDDSITITTSSSSPQPSGVFSRLGGRAGLKRAASDSLFEDSTTDLSSKNSLPYAGVLKNPSAFSPKKAKKTTVKVPGNFKIKKIVQPPPAVEKNNSSIQKAEVSTTTEGILSDFAKKESLSLRDRLGAKQEVPTSTSDVQFQSVKSTKKGGVQDRLGLKKKETLSPSSPSAVSSSLIISRKLKIAKQMGSSKISSSTASEPAGVSSGSAESETRGVFSRLGKKSGV